MNVNGRLGRAVVAAGVLAALGLGSLPATAGTSPTSSLSLSLCSPTGPNGHTFTVNIDNPYLPLSPVGRQWKLVGPDVGVNHLLVVTVNDPSSLQGRPDEAPSDVVFYKNAAQPVITSLVEEREWADANGDGNFTDSELIEVSDNYFAQTTGPQGGTVCYFGEHVDNIANQVVVNHDGSWRADGQSTAGTDNAPGIFMPIAPKPGVHFQQEFAPGVAEDQATVIGVGTVTVPLGTYANAIRVHETNKSEKDRGYKTYGPGVGFLTDDALQLFSFTP